MSCRFLLTGESRLHSSLRHDKYGRDTVDLLPASVDPPKFVVFNPFFSVPLTLMKGNELSFFPAVIVICRWFQFSAS